MVYAFVLVVLIGSTLALDIPPLKVKYLDDGVLEISIKGTSGLDEVKYITYSHGNLGDRLYTGTFHKTADDVWVHRGYYNSVDRNTNLVYRLTLVLDGLELVVSDRVKPDVDASVVVVPPVTRVRRGTVVFRDDFNGAMLNAHDWNYEVSAYGGYNGEFQVYTNDIANVFIRDGVLYLKPTLTAHDPKFTNDDLYHGTMDVRKTWGTCTNADNGGCFRQGPLLPPVMSGKVTTKKTIRYGKMEVRAQIPIGDWLWPAIWMMPQKSTYGGWPRSGEIDMMESRGNLQANNNGNHGVNQVSSNLHWGTDPAHNRFYTTGGSKQNGALWSSDYHIYSLDWTGDHLITYVDGAEIMNVQVGGGFWNKGNFPGGNIWSSGQSSAPFDQAFYLILNVAVAGTGGFFQDNWQYNTAKPWTNASPKATQEFWEKRYLWQPTWHGDDVAMKIDYIEMTQY